MSITYVGAIAQFLIIMGLITQSEAVIITEGFSTLIALATLLVTLYGRFRLGGIKPWGTRG